MIRIEEKHPCNYDTNTRNYSKNFKGEANFITIVTDFLKKKKSKKSSKMKRIFEMEIKP